MAGFSFLGGSSKPGPGVSKNAPQKPPVPRFFELWFRKFFELVKLNFLFLAPVVVAGILIYLISRVTTHTFLINLPLILLSPFVAGITFITRNYAREEHSFLISDFKDAVLLNWKQFAVNGVVCYVLGNLILFCVKFYYMLAASQGTVFMIPFGISVAVLLIFLFIQYYVPLMIVTFELNLKQIYKNGFIFAIVGLWRNILLTAIFSAVLFLNYFLYYMFSTLVILADVLLLVFLAFSWSSFLINFTVYPLIEKMMIQPVLERQQGGTPVSEPAGEADSQASVPNKAEGEEAEPEYVFYNGKLVKKSIYDNQSESIFEDRE